MTSGAGVDITYAEAFRLRRQYTSKHGKTGAGGTSSGRPGVGAAGTGTDRAACAGRNAVHRLGVVASFLGGQVLSREGLSIWIVLALIAFGGSIFSCIYVLLPKDDLVFALDGPEAYEALYDFRHDEAELDRRLAYWLRIFREANHQVLKRANKAFEFAGFALLAEIGCWVLGLVLG